MLRNAEHFLNIPLFAVRTAVQAASGAERLRRVLADDVVRAALDDAGRGDEGDLRLLLELGDRERPAVAHGRADL